MMVKHLKEARHIAAWDNYRAEQWAKYDARQGGTLDRATFGTQYAAAHEIGHDVKSKISAACAGCFRDGHRDGAESC